MQFVNVCECVCAVHVKKFGLYLWSWCHLFTSERPKDTHTHTYTQTHTHKAIDRLFSRALPTIMCHFWCSEKTMSKPPQTRNTHAHTNTPSHMYCAHTPPIAAAINRSWQLSKQDKFTQSCNEISVNSGCIFSAHYHTPVCSVCEHVSVCVWTHTHR